MVCPRDLFGGLEYVGAAAAENDSPDLDVFLHQRELAGGELAWLEQDAVVDSELADVVQRRCEANECCHLLRQAELTRKQLCGPAYALGVRVGVVVAKLGGESQATERFEPGLLECARPVANEPLEQVVVILEHLLGVTSRATV
jgi:hypothetical protein